jgi:hypothetical protein
VKLNTFSLLGLVAYDVNILNHIHTYFSFSFKMGQYKRKTEQLWTAEITKKALIVFQEGRNIR